MMHRSVWIYENQYQTERSLIVKILHLIDIEVKKSYNISVKDVYYFL